MPGVFAQDRPQEMRASVQLLDDSGVPLSPGATFGELMLIVHQLSWWRHIDLEWFARAGQPVRLINLAPH